MHDKVRDVIYYLVDRLGCIDSRTKLVKLLYLVDNLAKKKLGKTITGIRYVYHFYGPYSHEIIFRVADMCSSKEIVEDYDPFFDKYQYYKGDTERDVQLDYEEIEIIEEVIKEYGNLKLDKLLEIVYNTDEMKSAKPGQIILE